MKTRIFGSLLVLAILIVLYVLTGGDIQTHSQPTLQTRPSSSADSDFKSLKIN